MNSKMPAGVFCATKKDGTAYYRASVTYRNKHISLGSYASISAAHQAYLDANQLLYAGGSITDYSNAHALSFEKWVILCNFRDNGLYFPTPIYIRTRFFYYYFDPDTAFIFSSEDLFYYASHKIQQRGGHYFVAEYGMQVNIMNRYGIRNYAIKNKDYRFKNDNPYDFRYENVEVLNPYHGISILATPSGPKYKVQIHVNGYLTVGTYDNIIIAAIAYNKAADDLHQKGNTKAYQINFIEGISASKYAELYHAIEIWKH